MRWRGQRRKATAERICAVRGGGLASRRLDGTEPRQRGTTAGSTAMVQRRREWPGQATGKRNLVSKSNSISMECHGNARLGHEQHCIATAKKPNQCPDVPKRSNRQSGETPPQQRTVGICDASQQQRTARSVDAQRQRMAKQGARRQTRERHSNDTTTKAQYPNESANQAPVRLGGGRANLRSPEQSDGFASNGSAAKRQGQPRYAPHRIATAQHRKDMASQRSALKRQGREWPDTAREK